MTFVDHLKNAEPEKKVLEFAIGRHMIEGDLGKSIVTGVSPTHVVTIQQFLGDALGKGWKGIVGAYFRGFNRPASKYKFYPGKKTAAPVYKTFTADSSTDFLTSNAHGYTNGTQVFVGGNLPAPLVSNKIYYVIGATTNTFQLALTIGGSAIDLTTSGSGILSVFANDPFQGIDEVFDKDIPHSNTAWVRLECPSGSEIGIPDFDTKTSPPVGFTAIVDCQMGDIYDNTGAITSSDVLLVNPADVLTFGCKEIRNYPNSRIDFASLATLRTKCDETETPDYTTLPEGVGLTGKYFDGTNFNTFVSQRVDPIVQFDSSTGTPALGLSPDSFSVRWEGKIRPRFSETYTFYVTHDNGARLWVNGTAILDHATTWNDSGTATAGTHSGTIALTFDQFYDIKIEWNDGGGVANFKLEWQSASQPREVVPQDRLYPKAEAVPKYRTHFAFTSRSTFDDFLRQTLLSCNGTFQDINGKYKFFTLDGVAKSFDFNEANIIKNTFKYSPRFSQQELLNLPNRFIADGRDLDSQYLEKFDPQLFYDVTWLQELAGRINEETVYLGNTTRWQGLKNLAHYAKLKTSPFVCEFEGMPQTFPVLPGDIVNVTHSMPNWTNKQFLTLEATDKSIDDAPDERIFKLLEWE